MSHMGFKVRVMISAIKRNNELSLRSQSRPTKIVSPYLHS